MTTAAAKAELEALERQHKALVDYLVSKAESHDWHAVSDAANDIREIEAKQSVLRRIARTP